MKFDATAKEALRKWPKATAKLWSTRKAGTKWLQAQPRDDAGVPGPKLFRAGTKIFGTQPDGLWVYCAPEENYADAMAVEVCGGTQNFADKRYRYAPSTSAVVVRTPLKWLLAKIRVQGGGDQPRWDVAGTFSSAPTEDIDFPLRALRVLYFLQDLDYEKWSGDTVPEPHEFVAPYSSIDSFSSQKMQRFLKNMTPVEHLYIS